MPYISKRMMIRAFSSSPSLDNSSGAVGAASDFHQKSMTDGSPTIYDPWCRQYTNDMLKIGYTGFMKTAAKALQVCQRGKWLDAGAGTGNSFVLCVLISFFFIFQIVYDKLGLKNKIK